MSETINTGGPAFPRGQDPWGECNNGMSLRDYFAAKETLAEWDHPEAVVSQSMGEALAGPRPQHGWSCKDPEQWIAMLRWEAAWRSALKYIRADAMIAAREGKK